MKTLLLVSLFAFTAHAALPEDVESNTLSTATVEQLARDDQYAIQNDSHGDDCAGDQGVYDDGSIAPASSQGCPMRPLWNQLQARMAPFGFGMASGAWLACLETDILSPLLAGCSDPVAVGVELGLLGTLVYQVYTSKDEDNAIAKELKKTTTMAGILAGLIAWYQFHG